MSPVTLLALVGFFVGIVLNLFLLAILIRRGGQTFERVLIVLLASLLVWYAGNFSGLLLRQMNLTRVAPVLVWVDLVSFVGLGALPALLYHTLWLYYRQRFDPPSLEKRAARLALPLFYLPILFLPVATTGLFSSPNLTPLQKLGSYQTPFLIYLAASYCASAYFEVRILQKSNNAVERRVFGVLLPFFLIIPLFNFWVFEWGGSGHAQLGDLLVQVTLMAALFPTFAVAYFIYRYRFLNITVRGSLVTALLVLITLVVYVYGVRRVSLYLERELDAPPLLLEVTFLATVLLFFASLSGLLERWLTRFSAGQIRRYQRLAASISSQPPRLMSIDLVEEWFENLLCRELDLLDVTIQMDRPERVEGELYELRVGDHLVGYMDVIHRTSPPDAEERQAMRLLAHEIALAINRFQLMESKVQMERELYRKSHMEDLGRMAATISHNVKNPLSSLKTLIQLQKEKTRSEEQKAELEMMLDEIDRLSRTVSDLLRFSKEAAIAGIKKVDLNLLAESMRQVFQGDLEAHGLCLEIRAAEEHEIDSNIDLLKEVLSNLITNAIEASPPGKQITVEIAGNAQAVELAVEDEGQGIPVDLGQKVFEPFFTTKSRGTGLGLAIARHRVEQLGGTIHLGSTSSGMGARFVIQLPRSK